MKIRYTYDILWEKLTFKTCLAQLIEFVRSGTDKKTHVMILADLRNALDNLD